MTFFFFKVNPELTEIFQRSTLTKTIENILILISQAISSLNN